MYAVASRVICLPSECSRVVSLPEVKNEPVTKKSIAVRFACKRKATFQQTVDLTLVLISPMQVLAKVLGYAPMETLFIYQVCAAACALVAVRSTLRALCVHVLKRLALGCACVCGAVRTV
jgi:hypothetical protein